MSLLPWLAPGEGFPPTASALDEPNGLLAAGGDLSVASLLNAYSRGIFPWFSEGDPLLWWSPAPRTILWPKRLHLSRSMKKLLRQRPFEVSCDRAFAEVLAACAGIPRDGQDGSWITDDMQGAYLQLHEAGLAHSIECWQDGELAGGLYGVCLGGMFFGESMFSRQSNASKVALAHLCRLHGLRLIDCQMQTAHLLSLGAQQMSRQRFEYTLGLALSAPRVDFN